jgi:hypothetical protein
MNCKTCKHWTAPDTHIDKYSIVEICQPVDPDTFEPMVNAFEVRECRSPKIAYFERNPESTGITLVDASEYFARMLTGEDFGCVNHEAVG